MRRFPLHPVLFSAFPVLWLWAQNGAEVPVRDALRVLAVVQGLTLGVWLLAWPLLRTIRRAALATSALSFLALSYGQLWGAQRSAVLGLTIWGAALLAAIIWTARAELSDVGAATAGANVLGLVAVAGAVPIVMANLPDVQLSETTDRVGAIEADAPQRDIFYIVPDRYARADVLATAYDVDNQPFLDDLRAQGFMVLDEATTNYPSTAHSLAATLSMDYLDPARLGVAQDSPGDPSYLHAVLRDHEVGQVLQAAGYEYIHIGTWWTATQESAIADVVLNYDARSEFAQVFADTTIWPALRSSTTPTEEVSSRDRKRNHSEWQLDQLDRLAASRSAKPRFVLAHITLPHEPYVFDRDGSYVTAEQENQRPQADKYGRQLEYLNDRLRGIVDRLTDGPENTSPIVIIQADEGPHPPLKSEIGLAYRWEEATDDDLAIKFPIFSALRLPGIDPASVPGDLTPVNTFRLVLDEYLGMDLELLPNRAFIYPDEGRLYDFIEVTDRVRPRTP